MRRAHCRLRLRIVSVREERLHDISEAGARDEGFASVGAFAAYWDGLNADRGAAWWENPWVWAIGFEATP